MQRRSRPRAPHPLAVAGAALLLLSASPLGAQVTRWPVHSMDRPRPAIVRPGSAEPAAPPPDDAVVLFDGRSLEAWRRQDGGPARWILRGGAMEIAPGAGSLESRRAFGDVQLHLEWATPSPPTGEGQGRGNSGVFLMGRYEIQILDSYDNDTYPDGQAGALYGQAPPLVNASRPPGAWQSYDVVFRAPVFAADGTVLRPARATVLHNGILIHDNAAFAGATVHASDARYEARPAHLPIVLQDHGNPVRFRNIWVREIASGGR